MNPEQFAKLIESIATLSARSYTLTGAADWPLLAFVGGGTLILLGMMWSDLRTSITGSKREAEKALETHIAECGKENDKIWQAMRDCQGDCCPRKK